MFDAIRNAWNRLVVRWHPTRVHLLTATVEHGDSVRTIDRAITEEQAQLLIESAVDGGLPGWAELECGNLVPLNQPWQDYEEEPFEEMEDFTITDHLTEEERQILLEELQALGYDEEEEPEEDDDEFGLFE